MIRKNSYLTDVEVIAIIEQNYGETTFFPPFLFRAERVALSQVGGSARLGSPPSARSSLRSSSSREIRREETESASSPRRTPRKACATPFNNSSDPKRSCSITTSNQTLDVKVNICTQLKAYRYVDRGTEGDVDESASEENPRKHVLFVNRERVRHAI